MSYFTNKIIYIIVPSADVTEEMINCSKKSFYVTGDRTANSLRKNIANDKILFKIKEPLGNVFNNYKWYNIKDIRTEIIKEEWNRS